MARLDCAGNRRAQAGGAGRLGVAYDLTEAEKVSKCNAWCLLYRGNENWE